MRQPSIFLIASVALTCVTACSGHDARLEDAIRQYIAQRAAEVDAGCECFELLLNSEDLENRMFSSKEECLSTFAQPPEDEVVSCLKSVLSSSGHSTDDSTEIITCYTDEIADQTECHETNAGECSPTMCSSDIATSDQCRSDLTDEEVETLYYCASQ